MKFVGTTGARSQRLISCDHELKIDPERLAEILAGTKTHEIRVFDRNFRAGNTLKLNAYDRSTNAYTGQSAIVRVTNITAPGSYGLPDNIGVMSVALIDSADVRPEVNSKQADVQQESLIIAAHKDLQQLRQIDPHMSRF